MLVELDRVGKPPWSGASALRVQSLVDRYGGYFHRRPSFAAVTLEALFRGYVRPWEIPRLIQANEVTLRAMAEEVATLDLRQLVPSVDVPVVFMLGRHDRQLDSRIAATYLARLDAPRKSLIWFEHSAHNIPFEEPKRFGDLLRAALADLGVPLAGPARRARAAALDQRDSSRRRKFFTRLRQSAAASAS